MSLTGSAAERPSRTNAPNPQARGHATAEGQPEPSSARPRDRRRPTSVPSSATSTTSVAPSITSGRMRLSTMRRPTQSTDLLLKPTLTSFRLSSTPSTSRSVRSLRTVESAGTHVGSTSARPWATSSSGSNPLVPLCGRSTSDPLPSDGLTKNSSSFSTPTATQDVTQSVNHQLAPLCQPSGALFTPARQSAYWVVGHFEFVEALLI